MDVVSSLNVGLFGTDPDFLRRLGSGIGKKGTESDLLLWNNREGGLAITAIAPVDYPNRLLPFLQVASMCDFPIVAVDRLDAAFGEMVVALAPTRKRGLFVVRDPSLEDGVRRLTRDRLPGWITMAWSGDVDGSLRRLRELLPTILIDRDTDGPCTVVLDHAYDVRGVGTVALGFVRRGVLHPHDALRLLPDGRTVAVRSIQRFDEDQAAAPAGSRVGVALRGVEAQEIERGALLTADAGADARPAIELRPYRRVEFSREALTEGVRGYHIVAGLYTRPVVIDGVGGVLSATADRPVPRTPGELAYLVVLRGPGTLRILGHGTFPR